MRAIEMPLPSTRVPVNHFRGMDFRSYPAVPSLQQEGQAVQPRGMLLRCGDGIYTLVFGPGLHLHPGEVR